MLCSVYSSVLFTVLINLFFLSLTGNIWLMVGVTLVVLSLMLVLLFRYKQFLAITSMCWLGAQMSLCSVLLSIFSVAELIEFFKDLGKEGTEKVD